MEKNLNNTRSAQKQKERLAAAKKDFLKILSEIKPFIKKREFKEYSTAGKWQDTSNLDY